MTDVVDARWLTQGGCSVVWATELLDRAAKRGETVSLRRALSWLPELPREPPGGKLVVVVTGLAPAMDVLAQAERSALLAQMTRLVRRLAERWPATAVVFACAEANGRFRIGDDSSLRLRTSGNETIDLGRALWAGATAESQRLTQTPEGRAREPVHAGQWLRRGS